MSKFASPIIETTFPTLFAALPFRRSLASGSHRWIYSQNPNGHSLSNLCFAHPARPVIYYQPVELPKAFLGPNIFCTTGQPALSTPSFFASLRFSVHLMESEKERKTGKKIFNSRVSHGLNETMREIWGSVRVLAQNRLMLSESPRVWSEFATVFGLLGWFVFSKSQPPIAHC